MSKAVQVMLVACVSLVCASMAMAGDPDDIILYNNNAGSPLAGQWSLTYTPDAPDTFNPTAYSGGQVIFNKSDAGWTPQPNSPLIGDITGDGIDDLVVTARNPGDNKPYFFINETPTNNGVGELTSNSADFWRGTEAAGMHLSLGDITGDGMTDLVNVKPSGTIYQWTEYHSTGSDTGLRTWGFTGEKDERPLIGDFNGDGKDDIALRFESGARTPLGWIKAYLSDPDGDGLQSGGDPGTGTHDSYQVSDIVQGSVSNTAPHVDTLVGDINGDGIDDIVEVDNRYGTGEWVWVAGLTGASGAASGYGIKAGGMSWATPFAAPAAGTTVQVPLLGDMNGDGYDDIVEYREFPNTGGAPGDMFGQFLVAFTDAGTGDLFNSSFSGSITFALSADEAGNIPLLGQFTPEPNSLFLLALGGLALVRRRR